MSIKLYHSISTTNSIPFIYGTIHSNNLTIINRNEMNCVFALDKRDLINLDARISRSHINIHVEVVEAT